MYGKEDAPIQSASAPGDDIPIGTKSGGASWADFMKQIEEEQKSNPQPAPTPVEKKPPTKKPATKAGSSIYFLAISFSSETSSSSRP